jgi:hypothetical protein
MWNLRWTKRRWGFSPSTSESPANHSTDYSTLITYHPELVLKTKLRGLSPLANYIEPSDRRLSAKLVLTFAETGCYVVSVTDPYGRILEFLDWSRFFFQVAPQLYS